jgi:hypothetical protein
MGAIWAAFLARFVRVQNFFPASAPPPGWMTYFLHARAPQKKHTAQGGRSLAQVSTCKKDKIYSARLYKLEAFGRDNSPLVASPPPLAKTEGQRRTAPPETHTHQMNSFVRKRRANCLNTHLLRCSRENETLFFYSAAQLNYLLQTRGGERE